MTPSQTHKTSDTTLTSYSYEEVLAQAIDYFNGDELAANVWINKYALKDSWGNIYDQTPEDMHNRLASELHRIEQKYPSPYSQKEIYEALKDFKYIVPQGGPMTGIGNQFQVAPDHSMTFFYHYKRSFAMV